MKQLVSAEQYFCSIFLFTTRKSKTDVEVYDVLGEADGVTSYKREN
jgi:hypothetical protein